MIGVLTCEQVTARLTDLEEGALGPWTWSAVRLHLGLCPACRDFLTSLRRARRLAADLLAGADGGALAPDRALAGALAAIRAGIPAGPDHHPQPEAWSALEAGRTDGASLMLRLHLGLCPACRARRGSEAALELDPEALPASLGPLLPGGASLRWRSLGFGAGRIAPLALEGPAGASFHLVHMPGRAAAPFHRHLGAETTLVLDGFLQDGPDLLRTGDWMVQAPGTSHAPRVDAGPACWALVQLDGPLRFQGWRRFFA